MDAILQALSATPGVDACMVVSRDGLVIEQSGRLDDIDPDLMAATASEVFGVAETAGERLGKGAPEQVLVELHGGKVVISAVNSDVFLLVLGRKKVNLGLLRWEVQASAEKLREEL